MGLGELKRRAALFRGRHEIRDVPVDIDLIVERDLELRIVVVPNFFDATGVRASLGLDRTSVVVDAYCFDHMQPECRQALAHEVAHLELHHVEFWPRLNGLTLPRYIEAIWSSMCDEDYKEQERQANAFAGLILVPPEALAERLPQHLVWAANRARELAPGPVNRQLMYDIGFRALADRLAPEFNVPAGVLGITIVHHGRKADVGKALLGDCAGIDLRYPL